MRRFVVRRNIERYREFLRTEVNDERRRMLRNLLAEEEAKLAAMSAPSDGGRETPAEPPQPNRHDRSHRKPG